jgi:hypothetical protein
MIIAERTLEVETEAGERQPVQIRLYAPEQERGQWHCRYELDIPADGEEPARTLTAYATDREPFGAIMFAIQRIGLDLYTSEYHRQRKLHWLDGYEGYGFPVPRGARDLLIGDDVALFGDGG